MLYHHYINCYLL